MEKYNKRNAKSTKGSGEKGYSFTKEAWRRLKRNRTAVAGLVIVCILVFVAIFADFLVPYDPLEADYGNMFARPSAEHPFGTDMHGRDILSRCIYGTRYSIPISIVCMIMATIIGGVLGLFAAFFGGTTDNVLMRIMDIFQSIPSMLLAIIVVATLGTGIPQLVAAIAISSLPNVAKTVRAAILSVRSNEYVDSSICIGAGNLRLMFLHMLPNAVGQIIIYVVTLVSSSIMNIATLSYIGLGIEAPAPEWGAILSGGREFIMSYPDMVLYPGIMIVITILGFNLVADGLRDALDPRLK